MTEAEKESHGHTKRIYDQLEDGASIAVIDGHFGSVAIRGCGSCRVAEAEG